MIVLGIESTCDETACALVRQGNEVISHVLSSQEDLHNIYGGVFPELASRRHIDVISPVVEKALDGVDISSIGCIAVAEGPGLIGSLLVGMQYAKALAFSWNLPLIGVNHIEAHLYAAMMSCPNPLYPALGLVISGGHTFLVYMPEFGNYQLLGSTVDDAIGEAFDKVGVLLKLPYPGGPKLEKLAQKGDPRKHRFKAGNVKGRPFDFSFSGLKTQLLYAIQKTPPVSDEDTAHLAAAFQETALSDIVEKTLRAAAAYRPKALYVGGGVSCNQRLRSLFASSGLSLPIYWPLPHLTTDNAIMIAGLGYHKLRIRPQGDPLSLPAKPSHPLNSSSF